MRGKRHCNKSNYVAARLACCIFDDLDPAQREAAAVPLVRRSHLEHSRPMTIAEWHHAAHRAALPLAGRIARHWAPRQPRKRGLLAFLGPGLITGASDDDPSGVATYSQVGSQSSYAMAWGM